MVSVSTGAGELHRTSFEYDSLGRVSVVTGPSAPYPEPPTALPPAPRVRSEYDFLGRLKTTSVSSNASGATWTVVEQRWYDSEYDDEEEEEVESVGNGNLTLVVRPVLAHAVYEADAGDRKTRSVFDYRDRIIQVENALPPHRAVTYDNLGRVVQSATMSDAPVGAHDFGNDDADRAYYERTFHSQRGLAYRREIAIIPGEDAASRTFLASDTWFDGSGRAVGERNPTSAGIKTTYDGLGRPIAAYSTSNSGFASYSEVHNSNTSVLTNSKVIEQREVRYVSTMHAALGSADRIAIRRRAHDHAGDGSLSSTAAVVSYSGLFYDDAGRLAKSAEYGTCLVTFSTGGTAPDPDQGDPPSASSTVLVTATTYNSRGLVETTTNSGGTVTKILYDGLGRRYATIENFVDATVSWDAGSGTWLASNVGTTDGTDRVTSSVFDAQGRVVRYIAHQQYAVIPGDRDQVTLYEYGVSPTDSVASVLWSNAPLQSVTYEDGGVVTCAYNAQGEQVFMRDQNTTEHTYTRDDLGRITLDQAVPDDEIDESIVAISREYDGAGRLKRVASWDDGSAVVNDVRFQYTSLGQVAGVWQNSVGAIAVTGSVPDEVPTSPPSGATRLVAYTYDTSASGAGNYSRVAQMDYPSHENGGTPVTATLEYLYSGLNGSISRVDGIEIDGTQIVAYDYIGANVFAQVDYKGYSADVQLDRTLSKDGKRRTQGYDSQDAGVYPGLDRFGRVIRQDWVDGALDENSSLSTVPNRPQIVAIGYAYDAAGNRTRMVDQRPGSNVPLSWAYGYDGLHRLTLGTHGAWDGTSVSASSVSQAWTLDILGNWVEWKHDYSNDGSFASSEIEARVHDWQNNELTEREEDSVPIEDPIDYDAAGNLKTRTAGSVVTTYVHDAWNRLVGVSSQDGEEDVVVVLQQQFNGLNWRAWKRDTARHAPVWGWVGYDSELEEDIYDWIEQPPTFDERRYAYNANWQLLEERVDIDYVDNSAFETDTRVQHVWGVRYIDDPVLYRSDTDNDGEQYESNLMHLTDAMFSTVALIDWETASVVERVTYDPYGCPQGLPMGDLSGDALVNGVDLGILLGGWKSTMAPNYNGAADFDRDGDVDGADMGALYGGWGEEILDGVLSNVGNTVGFQGYLFGEAVNMYTVRNRMYDATVGRWIERDPLDYVEGMNLYQALSGDPVRHTDPRGLCSGACVGSAASAQVSPAEPPGPPPLLEDPNQEVPTYRSYPTDGPASLASCCATLWLKLFMRENYSMNYDAYTTCCGGKVAICSWVTPKSITFVPAPRPLFSPTQGPGGPSGFPGSVEFVERMREWSGHAMGVALAEECLLAHEREHAERPPFSEGGCAGKPDAWIEEDGPISPLRQTEADCDHCGIYHRQAQCMLNQMNRCANANGPAAQSACRRALRQAYTGTIGLAGLHCTRGGHGFGPLR